MKRTATVLMIMLSLAVILVSGYAQAGVAGYRKITPQEAHSMMAKQKVTVVDVRTESEYAEKHIKNAILVPVETIGDKAPKQLPDKNAVLLVYCRSGRRSQAASEALLKLGYKNVYDFGGIKDWPYETVEEAM